MEKVLENYLIYFLTEKPMENLPENYEKYLSAFDDPKETDFKRSDYFDGEYSEWTTKKVVDQVKIKIRNQYDQKETYKACSCYWLTGIFNGNQSVEFLKQWIDFEQEDPRRKRLAFQAERWYLDKGASLQEMMSFFKKRGLIDWYVLCENAEQCKNAINNWFLIYTWTNYWSRSMTSKTWELTLTDKTTGHCYFIEDFDETWFVAVNSFGEKWWKGWRFHINFEKYSKLFSTYAIIDHDDTGKIDQMLFDLEYQKAIENKITNGTRPNDPVTRKECAVMSYRVLKKALAK